ncbi:MAG TPA: HD domain-containing protein [Steroidobacteraceae bacterium]|nr:HD domain-containing protein [Steroidobacteraceae bacterium]
MRTVSFRQMKDGTKAEYLFLGRLERDYIARLPDRILHALRAMDDGLSGYRVTRLAHSLQTATRAEADGADEEMILGALVHDMGDSLAPENHSNFAAEIIRPYVRAEVSWVVEHHGLFQKIYYAHFLGEEPELRAAYREHPYYESCARFCERWDQAAFDPDYPTQSLEHFEPLVRRIFSRRAFDPAVLGRTI